MAKTENSLGTHTVRYGLVYANGWENGTYEARTTSANPCRCARMILIRVRSGNIVGVRISRIDDQRMDFLYEEERTGNGG